MMNNLFQNDQGGITYATTQRIGQPEHRSQAMADVRVAVEAMQELCEDIRRYWPERYPVPEKIDKLLAFCDYAMKRVRSGSLKKAAELLDQ